MSAHRPWRPGGSFESWLRGETERRQQRLRSLFPAPEGSEEGTAATPDVLDEFSAETPAYAEARASAREVAEGLFGAPVPPEDSANAKAAHDPADPRQPGPATAPIQITINVYL